MATTVSIDEWLEEDNLMLLECWARDGYTFQDIANRIGITVRALSKWRDQFPEINEALKRGREIIDYKVENALLKAALGYKTKESRVLIETDRKNGDLVREERETTIKEVAPNVNACQVWLYNRKPELWKKNRDNTIELNEDDSSIQINVIHANKTEGTNNNGEQNNTPIPDEEWEEVNESIEIRKNKSNQETNKTQRKSHQEKKTSKVHPKADLNDSGGDLDYWPEDWSDYDE